MDWLPFQGYQCNGYPRSPTINTHSYPRLPIVTQGYQRLPNLACSYINLHAVPWACMQLTRTSQCFLFWYENLSNLTVAYLLASRACAVQNLPHTRMLMFINTDEQLLQKMHILRQWNVPSQNPICNKQQSPNLYLSLWETYILGWPFLDFEFGLRLDKNAFLGK